MTARVVLEIATKRAFASAVDWPGWARGARTPADAVASLVAYAPRYERVARRAGMAFDPGEVVIVEELAGSSSTEFGIPGAAASVEADPLSPAERDRVVTLLRACWAEFDAAAARAAGVELRKGPRGGGRDVDGIIDHVREAESGYLGQLGARPPRAEDESSDKPMELLRSALLTALDEAVAGRGFSNPRNTKRPWSPRYTIRRVAWHVLDHAWEIEDRASPVG